MGKTEAERGEFWQFVPELGLESGPADLGQLLPLVPRVLNKGTHMSSQVRHGQAEMYPITGWPL